MRQKSQIKKTNGKISTEEKAILKDVRVQKSLLQLIKALIPHTFIFFTKEGRALFTSATPENDKEILLEVLADERAHSVGMIIKEALNVPKGYSKKKHVADIARQHGISEAQVYRYLQSYRSEGIAGLRHKNKK